MKRQFGMWIGILCILVIGISITKITTNFVLSNGTAAVVAETAVMAETTVVTESAAVAEPRAAAEPSAVKEPEAMMEAVPEKMMAVQENRMMDHSIVKSPLDPEIETKPAVVEMEESESVLTVTDFFQRFEATENSALKLWDNVTIENQAAYRAAAEQERVLWEYERNLIHSEIRNRISETEADELKRMEMEWFKVRDQYAERIAAKTTMMNSQNQNPAYIRAQAEKTKERCYWLVSEYEDILNQPGIDTADDIKISDRP